MSRTYGKQLTAGIAATLILMTVMGWLSLDNITSAIRINRTTLHAVETLASLENALLVLRWNPPAGIAEIDAASDEIRRIAAQDAAAPPHERLREERRKIILTRLDALKRAVERQSGPAGADIEALTAEIHFSIQEMEREELSALERRSQASARAAYRGTAMLMAGSVFSLGPFLTMAWLVRCGSSERRRAAALLKKNAHECRASVKRRTRALAVANNALKEEILERKRAEEKLREQAKLLELVPDAIAVHSLDGKILYWNQAAERMYGWSANEAKEQGAFGAMYRCAGEEFARARRELFQSGRWSGELRQTTRDGRDLTAAVRWVLVYDPAGRPQSALSISADITDRKRLEAQILCAQRLGSVGALAGGIAHDLSNILSPITLASQMLQMKLADPELQRWLHVMECSAQRGADMLKRVLAFARGVDGERHLFQPKHLVNEILRMLRDLMPKSIELRLTTRTDPWMIDGDATQIHQVLMNLCINARDAMPQGGVLEIEIRNEAIPERDARVERGAKPGRYVAIIVSDTGEGIAPQNLGRIFEPFFTTKERSKGTGLGLSTVLNIVESHEGFIDVHSNLGVGTRFTAHFPASDAAGPCDCLKKPPPPVGHGELILVADGEAFICEFAKGVLESFGYRVETARTGDEAVRRYIEHEKEIKAIVADAAMPGENGATVIESLRRINPQARIVAGGAGGSVADSTESPGRTCLAKPYRLDDLLEKLSAVLHSAPSAS
jgi:PAS domain S-box-containing protein